MILPWINKPIRGTQLNRQHPFVQNMTWCGLFNAQGGDTVFDALRNSNGGITGAEWKPTGLEFNASLNQVNVGSASNFLSGEGSIAFRYQQTNAPSGYYYFTVTEDAYQTFSWYCSSDGGSFSARIGGSLFAFGTVDVFLDGAVHDVVFTWSETDNNCRIYCDNIQIGNATSTMTFPNLSSYDLNIGGRLTGASRFAGGIYAHFFIFNKVLSPAERTFFHITPYEIIEPIFVPSFTSGGESPSTLLPNKCSVAVTGLDANISAGTTISSTTGSASIAGLTANISAGKTITGTTGAIVITGINADVATGASISVTTGAVGISGFNSLVSAGTTISGTVGAVTATGLQAAVSNSPAIMATTGTISISGLQANISAGKTIVSTTGAVVVTGVQASVSNENAINCTTGAVTAQGLAATVLAGTTMAVTTGAISITGFNADVENEVTITGTTGAVVATGLQADISCSVIIEATTGAVIITGITASVSSGGIPDTHTDRIYNISEENRIYSIGAENRIYYII